MKLGLLLQSVEKFKISIKSEKIMGHSTEDLGKFVLLEAVKNNFQAGNSAEKPILAFSRQPSTVLYCWKLCVGQER